MILTTHSIQRVALFLPALYILLHSAYSLPTPSPSLSTSDLKKRQSFVDGGISMDPQLNPYNAAPLTPLLSSTSPPSSATSTYTSPPPPLMASYPSSVSSSLPSDWESFVNQYLYNTPSTSAPQSPSLPFTSSTTNLQTCIAISPSQLLAQFPTFSQPCTMNQQRCAKNGCVFYSCVGGTSWVAQSVPTGTFCRQRGGMVELASA
ncbi:hypothetical protein HMI56_002402 [Coelomomyces lativittatus]|nr:hypothetical protein HMI56_002402 [Coelomomyces lativittatus]